MHKKQVAIIDIGSSKITAVVGERGTNKTFVIKGRRSYEYDGFVDAEFFDVNGFKNTLLSAADFFKKTLREDIDTVYVGVPSDFTQVIVKESQISFSKKKKINANDVDALFDAAFVMAQSKYTQINRSAIVYELDDYRRLANPIGATSEILKGKLSFILCDNAFLEIVKPTLKMGGFKNVECVSSSLAEAMYLVDAETRDRIALILDVGYITSTLFLVQGDGILYEKAFAYGGGFITAAIADKYEIDFAEAEALKRKVNLSRVVGQGFNYVENGNGKFYNIEELQAVIKSSLEVLCENISEAIDQSGYIVPEYVTLRVTGGGIAYIRGAREHLSGRLDCAVEVISPTVPLMENPTESSILSLMDLALEQN